MRHYLLTLLFLMATFARAFALSDDFVKVDLSGATASQNHLSADANIKPGNAIDGAKSGAMAGWNNGELKKSDGTKADSNTLDSGANTWTLDLGMARPLDAITIYFEGAYGTAFDIEFFNENPDEAVAPAETVKVTANTTTAFELPFDKTMEYRYIRLNFLGATNHAWGIKFYEVEFFRDLGNVEGATAQVTANNTGSSTIIKGEASTLSLAIFDADGNPVGTLSNFTLSAPADSGITIDGTSITATNPGTYTLTATVGEESYPVTVNVTSPISEMKNLVYTDGPWKAEISNIYSTSGEYSHPENMIDNNPDTQGGWADGKLGDSQTIAKGDAWFTIDMQRPCNISAVKIINELATINGYTIEFYANDPDAEGVSASPLFSYDYTTNNSASLSEENIYLPQTVAGAQYIKFFVTSIRVPAYGGRFRSIQFFGPDNDELKVDRLALSDNKLVVGRTNNIKVRALAANGTVIYDNLDATFGITQEHQGDVTVSDTKTADGYTFTGLKESIVPVTITAKDPNDNTKTFDGTAVINIASPIDQHVCLISHTTNKLSVAHQHNPVDPYNADNAINSVDNSEYFLSGWADKDLEKAADGTLDQHANWWIVDIGRTANAEAIRIHWGDHPAKRYKIEVFGEDVDLWNDYRNNPAAADGKAKYSQIVEYAGEETRIVRFDGVDEDGGVVKDMRRLRLTMLEADGTGNGIQFHEVCLLGRENPDFTIKSLALVRKDVNVGETRAYSIYGLTESGYTLGGLEGATLEIDQAQVDAFAGRIRIEENGRITGVKKGITPIILTWGGITTETFMEVTTADWTNTVNIARKYSTRTPSQRSKNGMTLGNPLAEASSYGIAGAENESVNGLIDGDWMSWTITAEEMRDDKDNPGKPKPYVTIDLGCVFPVNEFNIHWNTDGDGKGNGSYIMLSGNYRVYGSTNGEDWTEVYAVENRPVNTYNVDRHAFKAQEFRYMKFEFTSPKTYGQNVAMNEITIGGPEFYNAETDTYKDYPESYVLEVTTPRFDRSNVNDRQIDNDWIVTSTNVSSGNPMLLSYLAVDCYGRSYLNEEEEVEICPVDAEGNTGEPLTQEGTKMYRDIRWNTYPYTPAAIGKETFTARIKGAGTQPQVAPLTVYTITDRGNVNRYSYAYDNAVDQEDRDFSSAGTAPQNAADGNFGSWYVIGYSGDAANMGAHYRFPAGTDITKEIGHPYELVMDYRGENYATKTSADRFVKELDMLGIQYEGAFARDYKVYLLHCDDAGNVADNAEWEEVASFVNLQPMGVGVTETQRIYPANPDGTPALDADGRIIPWTNVAAIKVEMLTTGTQWGIKMMESAIYGKLNKTVIPLAVDQARYATHAGYTATQPVENGAYYSFDLALSTPFNEADYVDSELQALRDEIKAVKSYRIALEMHQPGENGIEKVAFTDGQLPSEVLYFAADSDEEKTVTGAIDSEGDFIFTIPAVKYTDGADIADALINRVLIRDVNPSMTYRATAIPLDATGTPVTDMEVDKSLEATLLIPQSAFTPGSLAITTVNGEIDNRTELMTADGPAMSLGSNATDADGRKSYYNNVNAAVIRGSFAALPVTDRVTDNWTIVYSTNLSIDGNAHNFVTEFGNDADSKVKATAQMEADVTYVPLHTTTAKAETLTGDMLAGAPDHIRNIDLTVLDTEKTVDVLASNVVAYTNGEKSGTSFVASDAEATKLPQNTLAATFAAPVADNDNVEKKVLPIGWVWNPVTSDKPFDAIIGIDLQVNTTANAFAGFHATNSVHAAKVDEGVSILHGGHPLCDGDDIFGISSAIMDYNPAAHNFGQAAVKSGRFALRLSNVHDAIPAGEKLQEIPAIYTLLTAEYPLALCPVETQGEGDAAKTTVTAAAHPMLSVDVTGARTTYNGAAAAPEGDGADPVHLQVLSAATAVTAQPTLGDLTAISGVAADRSDALTLYPNPAETDVTVSAGTPLGTVEIFTLGGARVSATDTDDTTVTVNVSNLGSGVYIVRAAGAATRLIKK